MTLQQKISSSLLVAIVGDALGVPVESTPRNELSLCSVKNMLGYGRYDHPQGTWSDDTSMILCTIESFLKDEYSIEDLGRTFCEWIFDAYWTPDGYVFDSGLTTFLALDRIRNGGFSAQESGGRSDEDNGNGSLMRILPAALYFHHEKTDAFLSHIHEISAITHAHPRSMVGCGIYSLFIRELLSNPDKKSALRSAVSKAMEYYENTTTLKSELPNFIRILSLSIPDCTEAEINSSGYIVDTLEASIWCFLRHETSKDIILSAVNLGLDTDTTGVVAGGLAGLHHGTDSIPVDWTESLARHDEINLLVNRFAEAVASS